jgi:dolichol-phosphate mannosyltransferase
MTREHLISVVVPLHNEEESLPALHQAICQVTERLRHEFELIFVNDGSTDRSEDVVRGLHELDPRVKLVSLSRNFGKQTAIFAGLDRASGAAIVVMDADLQHPPAVIEQLVARWRDGDDVVFAVQEGNDGASWLSRALSGAFARFFGLVVRLPRIPHASDFLLMDRKVLAELRRIRERNRFFRCLVAWVGFRQTAIPYTAARRHAGQTKFALRSLIALAVDAVTSFSSAPLRLCTYAGFFVAFSCVPYTLWAIYQRLFTDAYVPGWPALIVAILFLGSVQLIGLGILGEYIGRIYDEVKERPIYIAQEQLGFDGVSPRLIDAPHHSGPHAPPAAKTSGAFDLVRG